MKRFILLTAIGLFLLGSGSEAKSRKAKGKAKTTLRTTTNHQLTGKATYYGSEYKSTRKTASGEKFNKNAYTAAHKTLPFGTMVKVTNKKNGKSVTVKINDRGPFGPGRVIDLSPVAARGINMIKSGVAPVEIEIVNSSEEKSLNT